MMAIMNTNQATQTVGVFTMRSSRLHARSGLVALLRRTLLRCNPEIRRANGKPPAGDLHHHCIISGTGRTGTSFLVQLLTNLGKNTGFRPGSLALDEVAKAGLEYDLRHPGCPYIVKNPWLCDYIDEVLAKGSVVIDRAYIPIRDLQAAAESRVRVQQISGRGDFGVEVPGGLWHTKEPASQDIVLLARFYKLVEKLSRADIPIVFMQYPRIVNDAGYLYKKLELLVGDIEFRRFRLAFQQTVQPQWVHTFNENDV